MKNIRAIQMGFFIMYILFNIKKRMDEPPSDH
jgi:hypothetical protein